MRMGETVVREVAVDGGGVKYPARSQEKAYSKDMTISDGHHDDLHTTPSGIVEPCKSKVIKKSSG